MAKTRHTYTFIGAGVDINGWWKYTLGRDDGQVVRLGKTRYRELRKQGRITERKAVQS